MWLAAKGAAVTLTLGGNREQRGCGGANVHMNPILGDNDEIGGRDVHEGEEELKSELQRKMA